jgi:hypothetical protein
LTFIIYNYNLAKLWPLFFIYKNTYNKKK